MTHDTTRNTSTPLSLGGVIVYGLFACLLYGIAAGVRADIGILLEPLTKSTGLSYKDVSFAIAFLQLFFGATQPFFGILAMRKSNRVVLLLGIGLVLAGLGLTPFVHSLPALILTLGILFGAGGGALSFALILSSCTRRVGLQNAMVVAGMLNAASGMGSFILSPLIQRLLMAGGVTLTLGVLCIPFVVLIPVVFVVTSADKLSVEQEAAAGEDAKSISVVEMFKDAFANRTYRLLVAGFSTCGFHMVIIEAHLISQFASYGIEEMTAAWTYSLYGIFTIGGALLSGYLSSRINKGKLVAFYYGFRVVWVALFIFLMPKTLVACIIFAVGLGMTGDATVSPTSGLVNENFSLARAATLTSFLFLVHQIGAFASSWLGGILLEVTGGYEAIWALDIAVCSFAFIMSARIGKEKPQPLKSAPLEA